MNFKLDYGVNFQKPSCLIFKQFMYRKHYCFSSLDTPKVENKPLLALDLL